MLNFPITFAYLIGESRLFRRLINILTYLFIEEFLVDNIYGSSINNIHKLK